MSKFASDMDIGNCASFNTPICVQACLVGCIGPFLNDNLPQFICVVHDQIHRDHVRQPRRGSALVSIRFEEG